MDISELKGIGDEKVKKVIVGKIRDAAAKRYNRAIENEEIAPAISSFRAQGGKVTVKGKSGEYLNKELQKGYYFLNSSTSKSANRKEYIQALEERLGQKLDEEQSKNMWQAIDRVQELWKLDNKGEWAAFGSLGSGRVQKAFAKLSAKYKKVDTIVKHAKQELEKEYKKQIAGR
jgi:hypothetical protein